MCWCVCVSDQLSQYVVCASLPRQSAELSACACVCAYNIDGASETLCVYSERRLTEENYYATRLKDSSPTFSVVVTYIEL